MQKLGDYCFDDERMIIIPEYSFSQTEKIQNSVYKNDKYCESYEKLENMKKRAFTSGNCLPISAGIAVTNNCQLRCRYCINNSKDGSIVQNNFKDIKALIDYMVKNIKIRRLILKTNEHITLFFTGAGEPTYNWEQFKRIIYYLRKTCFQNGVNYVTNLTTNGMLNMDQINFIAENINNVMVSFDGLPEVQDRNRPLADGRGSSIYVLKVLEEFDRRGIQYSIRSTVWHRDLERLCDMASYIYNHFKNFTNWSILPVISGGRATNYGMGDLDCDVLEMYGRMWKIISEKYNKNNGHLMFLPTSISDLMCGAMYISVLWLYPSGELKVCVDGGEFSPVVGHIKDGKVKLYEMFSNDLYTEYKKRYSSCKQCIAFRLCAGGCPVKFMRKSNYDSAQWECDLIKKYWTLILDKVAHGESIFGWSGEVETLHKKPNIDIIKLKYNGHYVTNYQRRI